MRRLTFVLALASMGVMVFAGSATAASPHAGCSVGPVDAGNSTIGSWVLMDEEDLAAGLDAAGFNPDEAAEIFAKEDKNGDGLLCVMTQVLPNDSSGSDTWFVSHDNTAREKS